MAGLMIGWEKCGVLGKERMPDKKTAKKALAAYGYRKGSRRIHWCIFCEGYHMTKGVRGKPGHA